MPTFFEKDKLSSEELARWDFAIEEYKRTRERNLEHSMANLTNKDRLFYSKQGQKTDEEIKQRMREMHGLMGNEPGHPKSALFARLLKGLPALEMPPPTSYSYPWYSVIEEAGPHGVHLGGGMTMSGMMKSTGGAEGFIALSINQCSWAAKSSNAAAQELLRLEMDLQKTRVHESHDTKYAWTDDLLKKVKAAYKSKPEFIVQHGSWPEYRLFVGQPDITDEDRCSKAQRRYAERQISGQLQLQNVGSVFDIDRLCINGAIGRTLFLGKHPKVRLEEARARLEQINASNTGGFIGGFEQTSFNNQLASLEADVIEYENDTDGEDWVIYTTDQWQLQKLV